MTLDLPQQAPPDQLAHSSKVQELQRAFATSDYCLLTSDLYRVKRAYFAAVAYLETNDVSTAERVRNYLAADQPGGETLLVFDTGCAHSITPVLDDFVTKLEEHAGLTISGFTNADSVTPQGAGWVEWPIRNINGTTTVT